MEKSFLLLALGLTTPFTIYFLGSLNYYSDYLGHFFQSDPSGEVYDFIIVGSGSSGAVVAYRLSQYYKVLLLEAGGDPIALNHIPGLALDLLGYPEYDWGYKTVPQSAAGFGTKNNQITSNRGKVLGGTSVLNYMLYLRGHPLDYDNWANITGDSGWKYDNLLPFFRKSLKEYRGKFKSNKKHYEASPYGFLTVESMNWTPMRDIFKKAAGELGIPNDIDANGPQTSGFGNFEVTQDRGVRMSTYTAILQHLTHRKNLRILKYAHVTKIKLGRNRNAEGVWYSHHGTKKLAIASKEVILSGGSYDSPKLLMLSGIGPKEELEKLGIKSKVNLPGVGKNLQDHIGAMLFPITINTSDSFFVERDLGLSEFYQYFVNGLGALTAPSAVNGQGFFSTSIAVKEGRDWSNIQIMMLPIAPSKAIGDAFSRAMDLKSDSMSELMDDHHGQDGFNLVPLLVRPKGRGEVTLKDKNPFSDPLIDPKFLQHPDDIKALVEAFQWGVKFVEESVAFKEVGAKLGEKSIQSCKQHKFRTDAYWECHIRRFMGTVWHPVGTCAMGNKNEKGTVVDSNLRVLGIQGLRVIDASIMPVIVNANTNAPAMMIGEKGADMILEYWSNQRLVCSALEIFLQNLSRETCHYL